MGGLVPTTNAFFCAAGDSIDDVGGRNKSGHGERWVT
jgi:hypothetical protein